MEEVARGDPKSSLLQKLLSEWLQATIPLRSKGLYVIYVWVCGERNGDIGHKAQERARVWKKERERSVLVWDRWRKRVRKRIIRNAYTLLYVMDTIVLYVTLHTKSVFIYVSPNTMRNLRAVLSRTLLVDQTRGRDERKIRYKKRRWRKRKKPRNLPYLFVFELEGPKFSVFVRLCYFPGKILEFSGALTRRVISVYTFIHKQWWSSFILLSLKKKNLIAIFSSCSSRLWIPRYTIWWTQAYTDDKPTSAYYLPIDVRVCHVRVCMGVCVCVYAWRVLRQYCIWYISKVGKGERGNYVGTSKGILYYTTGCWT